eukprot:CFRG3893T1
MSSDDEGDSASVETEVYGHFHKLNRKYEHNDPTSSDDAWYAYEDTTGTECIWNTLQATRFNTETREKLERRLNLLTQMNHSNICKFMDYWVNSDKIPDMSKTRYFVHYITEVMTSGTLKRYLGRHQKTKPQVQQKVWQRWCRQILSALHRLHHYGITHGNLSLDTVFLQTNGLVKIGDLCLGDLKSHIRTNAASNDVPNYRWAPELYDSESPDLHPSIDIYAFGMLVLEMATSQTPYHECKSFTEVYQMARTNNPPKDLDTITNPELQDFIAQCLRSKDERPTAKELLCHRFLFEVPPLKVFAAHYILKSDILHNMALKQWSVGDDKLTFLQDVDSGTWGFLANVRLRETRRLNPGSQYLFMGKNKERGDVPELMMLMVLSDGMRRQIQTDYNAETDTPESLAYELVQEGLLCDDERARWQGLIEKALT